jgi:hypothetical protein
MRLKEWRASRAELSSSWWSLPEELSLWSWVEE